ncbi:MAG TPA: protein kinase, partial [Gemmataceae bacterium]|nr:protein kinase [Gemmataceae bacterium]
DFGLAKRLQEDAGQTKTGSILGTPGYMAPEQAEGKNDEVGPPADVYALGAILYELLTGRTPFRAPTLLETLEQVRTREPVAPVELQPSIPRDLETICLKCLQKDPRRRYDGAGALAEDLRRFLAHEPILARRVGRIERAWRWCRRNPRLAGLSAAVIAIVVAWAVSMSLLAWGLKLQKEATDRNAAAARAAQADAVRNAAEARANEIKADANAAAATAAKAAADQKATEARDNAQKANTNAAIARANAEKAYNTAKVAVARMTETAGRVQDALDAALFSPGKAPQLRDLRDDLVSQLRDEMLGMAKDIEATKATPFAQTAMYQQVGDRLKHLGKGEEALEQFRLGCEIAERTAAERPNDDKSRGNLGVMLKRLGDMQLELNGDARAAHEYYEKGRALQQDVADHPRSGDYTELKNTVLLSHYETSLGKADLALGDDASARDHFDKALSMRRKWCASQQPVSAEARSYLTEALSCRGTVAALLGDAKKAQDCFDEAVSVSRGLVEPNLAYLPFQADLADVLGACGDAQLRQAKLDDAAKSYRESLEHLTLYLEKNADHTEYQALLARTHERLATVAALKGDRDGAAKAYQEALRLRLQLLDIEPNNLSWQAGSLPTLAHCGKEAEAATKATDLVGKHPKSVPLLLDAARCYAAGAATAADADVKKQFVAQAVASLRAAMDAGYKDGSAWKTDPGLAPIGDDAGYRALLEELAKKRSGRPKDQRTSSVYSG